MSEISQRRCLEIVCEAFHIRFFLVNIAESVLTPNYETVKTVTVFM
jgi:hypothetical protein